MRCFDSLRILVVLACAACGSKSEPPAPPARVDSVLAPAPQPAEPAPTPAAAAAEPAAPDPSPAPAEPAAPPKAPAATPDAPQQAAKPASGAPDKPRPSRTQSSIETEKLNRASAAVTPAPSPIPAEPIAQAPEPPPPSAPEPAPAPAPPPPAAKPAAGRVVVPSTARMSVEVPAGLQRWLDADTRMQPWLNKVIPVIDRCYGNVLGGNPNAKGTISLRVTMHANARPDPDVQSLPGELSGIVTCATGQLIRTKMPLFTGTEGESYTVKVRFGE